jgi:hypothetical protein
MDNKSKQGESLIVNGINCEVHFFKMNGAIQQLSAPSSKIE